MVPTTDIKPLWDFALALYSSPGVEETALVLQDELGANVNIILWACWLEGQGVALTSSLLQQAESAIAPWDRQFVQVLRQLRRRAKELEAESEIAGELRSSLKQAELLCERQVLSLLQRIKTSALSSGASAGEPLALGDNMEFYLDSLNAKADLQPIKNALTSLSTD